MVHSTACCFTEQNNNHEAIETFALSATRGLNNERLNAVMYTSQIAISAFRANSNSSVHGDIVIVVSHKRSVLSSSHYIRAMCFEPKSAHIHTLRKSQSVQLYFMYAENVSVWKSILNANVVCATKIFARFACVCVRAPKQMECRNVVKNSLIVAMGYCADFVYKRQRVHTCMLARLAAYYHDFCQ